MRAFLIRIGIDQAFGNWNAPVDPITNNFVYIPIPESPKSKLIPQHIHRFTSLLPHITNFCTTQNLAPDALRFSPNMNNTPMHLDPDFAHLTYGDDGSRRGAGIKTLTKNDLLVFYAGLRPSTPCQHKLLYAIIGLYVVNEILPIPKIPAHRWHENAHTRKSTQYPHDIVVRAIPKISGRLKHCIPIGEYRSKSYRVRNDLLKIWGGLSVKDGFIQRSAVPPEFTNPQKFYKWFQSQNCELLRSNN